MVKARIVRMVPIFPAASVRADDASQSYRPIPAGASRDHVQGVANHVIGSIQQCGTRRGGRAQAWSRREYRCRPETTRR